MDQIKAALDLYTLDKLSYIYLTDTFDPQNVLGDVQLLRPRQLGLDGSEYSITVTSDSSYVQVNGYRANILPQLGQKTAVKLTVTIKYKANADDPARSAFPGDDRSGKTVDPEGQSCTF